MLSADKTRQEINLVWPSFLPDGRHFLYYATNNDTAKSGIRIGSIDSDETLPLVSGTGPAFYVPEGYVLFTRQNTAFALPFDATTLRATGEAVAVIDGVGLLGGPPGSTLTVSQTGVLAYRNTSATDVQLTWYDHLGKRFGEASDPGPYRQAALSPDGKRAVLERLDPATNTWDLWLLDLTSRISSRLTFDPADDTDPVWSPDGRQIAFASLRQGHLDIYRKVIGASKDELVYADNDRKVPEWWLKDGTILYTTSNGKEYHVIAAEGERRPKQIFHADFTYRRAVRFAGWPLDRIQLTGVRPMGGLHRRVPRLYGQTPGLEQRRWPGPLARRRQGALLPEPRCQNDGRGGQNRIGPGDQCSTSALRNACTREPVPRRVWCYGGGPEIPSSRRRERGSDAHHSHRRLACTPAAAPIRRFPVGL